MVPQIAQQSRAETIDAALESMFRLIPIPAMHAATHSPGNPRESVAVIYKDGAPQLPRYD